MGNFVAIASILLALIAAGSIAFIAWELTSEDDDNDQNDDNDEPGSTRPDEKN